MRRHFSLGTPAHFGKGAYFVSEADEYVTDPTSDSTPRFLWQNPDIAVITNIEFDHPDVYRNISDIKKAFISFAKNIKRGGFIVCGIDNKNVLEIVPKLSGNIITFGGKNAQFQYKNVVFVKGSTTFEITKNKKSIGKFSLRVPGIHNVLNALATVAVLYTLDIPVDSIRASISLFSGTKRRFELVEKRSGVLFYDDYAHHPTEVFTTLFSIKQWFPEKKLTVIFQPHTYSRTKKLLRAFSKCFSNADNVLIVDIYSSAREKPISSVSGKILTQEISKYHSHAFYTPTKEHVIQYLGRNIGKNDIIITMGAGDIYKLYPDITRLYKYASTKKT